MPKKDWKDRWIHEMDGKEFRAAGMCFYHGSGKDMKLLMIQSDRGWEFPGGQVDESDYSLYNTAIREATEETNGCMNHELSEKFKNASEELYLKNIKNRDELEAFLGKSRNLLEDMLVSCESYIHWIPEFKFKYGLFITEVPDSWIHPNDVYGQIELWEGIPRKIHWLPVEKVIDIIDDNSVKKLAMFKMNTYLKKIFRQFLVHMTESNGGIFYAKMLKKWILREDD